MDNFDEQFIGETQNKLVNRKKTVRLFHRTAIPFRSLPCASHVFHEPPWFYVAAVRLAVVHTWWCLHDKCSHTVQSLCFGRWKYLRLILEMLSFGLSLNPRVFLLVFTCRILILLCFVNLRVKKKNVWNSIYLYLASKIYFVRGPWLRFWWTKTV